MKIHHAALLFLLAAGSVAAIWFLCDASLHPEYVRAALPGSYAVHVIAVASAAVLGIVGTVRLVNQWRTGRWTSTSLAPFRWGFSVVVTSLVIEFCVQAFPYYPLAPAIACVEGFGVYALGLLIAHRVPVRIAKAADVIVFNLALLPVTAELFVRSWNYVHPIHLLDYGQVDSDVWVHDYRFEPGQIHYGFPCNRDGFFDTDPPTGKDRGRLVVCIGDSFSASVVPHPFHFTTVSETRLPGVEVYNVGIARADPTHYLSLLKSEALRLQPDLIVIDFFVGNDLVLRRPAGHRRGGLKSWLDRNGFALYVLYSRMRILRRESESLGISTRKIGEVDIGSTANLPRTVDEWLTQVPWLSNPLEEEPSMSDATFMDIETRQARRICRPPSPETPLDYSLSLEVMQAMLDAAGSIPLVVMIIPDEFQVEDALWETILRADDTDNLNRYLPQEVVRDWLDSRGVAYLDLLPILRAEAPLADGRLHLYHRNNTHFNARGNRVAGEALAEFLREQLAEPR